MASEIYAVGGSAADRASIQAALAAQPEISVQLFESSTAFLAQAATLAAGIAVLNVGGDTTATLTALRSAAHLSPLVIVPSGNITAALQAMKQGAVDFVEKPFTATHLADVVATILAWADDGDATTRAEAAETAMSRLSEREKIVLKGLLEDKPAKAITTALQISPRTLEIYRASILSSLGVISLADALRIAFPGKLFA